MDRVINLELPIELPNGEEFSIQAMCEVTYDPDYGADADGNRGEASYFTGPVVIKNMGEVMKAIELAVDDCSDDFIEELKEQEGHDGSEDFDTDDEEEARNRLISG
jgi:hypothetical protein